MPTPTRRAARARKGGKPELAAANRPLLLLTGAFVAVLVAVSARYGYHRDELYFIAIGGHPAFGYVDQPPLVPLLAHALDAVGGHHLTVLRLPAALAAGGIVVLTALITRAFGGGRGAQLLAAACVVCGGAGFAVGHLLGTTVFDVLLWTAITLAVLRALDAGGPRWLIVGALAGVALEVKTLPVFLLFALLVGIVTVGDRRALWSPWLAAGALLALALWLPNLIWQATHGWPQFELARSIANGNSGTSSPRARFVPMVFLQAGPPLAPLFVAGLVRLVRERALRWLGVALLVLVVVFIATAGKPYYLIGLYPAVYAAGAQPVIDWARGWKRRLVPAALVASVVPAAVITLPIVPLATLPDTPIVAINYDTGEQVGWPRFADTVADTAVAAHAPVITINYGEAGALRRYRPDVHTYGAHNSFWDLGRPADGTPRVVAVGWYRSELRAWFTTVRAKAKTDNGHDVDNDEQGGTVYLCTGPRAAWAELWKDMRRLG